jgi:uncharacterized lipoprotein YddW (UPF0748 family)
LNGGELYLTQYEETTFDASHPDVQAWTQRGMEHVRNNMTSSSPDMDNTFTEPIPSIRREETYVLTKEKTEMLDDKNDFECDVWTGKTLQHLTRPYLLSRYLIASSILLSIQVSIHTYIVA